MMAMENFVIHPSLISNIFGRKRPGENILTVILTTTTGPGMTQKLARARLRLARFRSASEDHYILIWYSIIVVGWIPPLAQIVGHT
jgi:hypothetical protein